EDAREGPQLDLASLRIAADGRFRLEAPVENELHSTAHVEPIVEGRRPATGERRAERPDADFVDADSERLARLGPPHLDRADERVPRVELLVARLEFVPGRDVPSGIETREGNRVAALDRHDRRKVTREMTVQRVPLERNLVRHLRGTPIQASRGASRTRNPPRLPSSKNSHSETACHSSASSSRAISAGT